MLRSIKIFAIAGVASATAYTPLLLANELGETPAPYSEQVEVAIPFGDLNLATADGQEKLRSRVKAASRKLCNRVLSKTLPLYGDIQRRQCVDQAALYAEPQIQLAIVRSRSRPDLAASTRMIVIADTPQR